MRIEVNHKELKNISTALTKNYDELKKSQININQIVDSLENSLKGIGIDAIVQRIKTFNNEQFSKIITYTKLFSEKIELTSSLYADEESSFKEKAQREVISHE